MNLHIVYHFAGTFVSLYKQKWIQMIIGVKEAIRENIRTLFIVIQNLSVAKMQFQNCT